MQSSSAARHGAPHAAARPSRRPPSAPPLPASRPSRRPLAHRLQGARRAGCVCAPLPTAASTTSQRAQRVPLPTAPCASCPIHVHRPPPSPSSPSAPGVHAGCAPGCGRTLPPAPALLSSPLPGNSSLPLVRHRPSAAATCRRQQCSGHRPRPLGHTGSAAVSTPQHQSGHRVLSSLSQKQPRAPPSGPASHPRTSTSQPGPWGSPRD